MRRSALIFLGLTIMISGCASPINNDSAIETDSIMVEPSLPDKSIPDSPLAIDSPIDATNIDQYLFIDGVQYVDLRSIEQLQTEGMIAGFEVIPFYDVLVSYDFKDNVLFTMRKDDMTNADVYLGDVGTFYPNYEESESVLKDIFQDDAPIVFMSTAGVESAYMINLLIQYGYDPALLYNAGTFTNGMGDIIAYRDYANHQYYLEPNHGYGYTVSYDFGELTPIE